jgi:hypothetical protein
MRQAFPTLISQQAISLAHRGRATRKASAFCVALRYPVHQLIRMTGPSSRARPQTSIIASPARRFRPPHHCRSPRTSSRTHRRCWTAGPDLGERWPSRLVATASSENCLILLQIVALGLDGLQPRFGGAFFLCPATARWRRDRCKGPHGLFAESVGASHDDSTDPQTRVSKPPIRRVEQAPQRHPHRAPGRPWS